LHGGDDGLEVRGPYVALQRYGDMDVEGEADVDDLLGRQESEVLAFEVMV
jgi:hypothetical protein